MNAMKLSMVSGKDLSKLCRKYYHPWIRRFVWVMAEIAVMGSDIQEVIGMSIGLNILFGIKLWICVIITIFSTFVILMV